MESDTPALMLKDEKVCLIISFSINVLTTLIGRYIYSTESDRKHAKTIKNSKHMASSADEHEKSN